MAKATLTTDLRHRQQYMCIKHRHSISTVFTGVHNVSCVCIKHHR